MGVWVKTESPAVCSRSQALPGNAFLRGSAAPTLRHPEGIARSRGCSFLLVAYTGAAPMLSESGRAAKNLHSQAEPGNEGNIYAEGVVQDLCNAFGVDGD
jgi:hypothetical protein